MTANSVSIGILGATGYTGAELLRLVQDHPSVRVACMTSERYAGQPIAAVFPHLAGRALPTLVEDRGHAIPARSTWCSAACRTARRRTSCASCRAAPRWSISRPTSGCATRSSTSASTASRTARSSASGTPSTGSPSSRARPSAATRPRRQPRLLSDHRAAAAAAAARGRPDRARPDHHRCQVGRHRRRPRRQGGFAAQRGQRGPARLRRRQPPPRAGDRAGPVGGRRARRSR